MKEFSFLSLFHPELKRFFYYVPWWDESVARIKHLCCCLSAFYFIIYLLFIYYVFIIYYINDIVFKHIYCGRLRKRALSPPGIADDPINIKEKAEYHTTISRTKDQLVRT